MIPSLEEDIELLRKLDSLRIASAKQRDQGYEALSALIIRRESHNKAGEKQPLEIRDHAQVILALCELLREPPDTWESSRLREVREIVESLAKKLDDERPQRFWKPNRSDFIKLSIFHATMALEALVAVPGYTFSKLLPFLYYLIIRELYTADAPDWAIGGARPSDKEGVASAFMTNRCVHALVGLARVQETTADFIAKVGEIKKRSDQFEKIKDLLPEPWRQMEASRLRLSLKFTIQRFSYRTVLPLPKLLDDYGSGNINDSIKQIISQMREAAASAVSNFKKAATFIERKLPTIENDAAKNSPEKKKRLERAKTAHAIGLLAIQKARRFARKAHGVLSSADWENDPNKWKQIEKELKDASDEVYDLLHPVKNFLSSVLDREIAIASGACKGQGDLAEMAFAAAAYGTVARDWKDERLRYTVNCLTKGISDRGRFPVGRPFHATEIPFNAGIIGALTLLLKRGDVSRVEPSLAEKLLNFFEDTRAEKSVDSGQQERGWAPDYVPPPRSTEKVATAIAVRSLALINRMLDDQINARILDHHFSVKWPDDLKKGPNLDSLFYPDYGLRLAPKDKDTRRKESVGILLQKMRAHVEGCKGEEDLKDEKPLHSLVLHGPTGTGKTTLVEALANSCEVPLVEVTPSDIVIGGEEAVERRARAVFKALSLLTRAVILFDEFEPVLLRRKYDEGSRNVFAFLTPGMLPKLKGLNEQTKRRSVAYLLLTNRIGYLDEAAVRHGRFEEKVGIYPPDLLSRTGRFVSMAAPFIEKQIGAGTINVADLQMRLAKVVLLTSGAGMEDLARNKGWFKYLDSKQKIPTGTPLDYFVNGGSELTWPKSEAKLEYNGILNADKEQRSSYADREWFQWAWVRKWDEKLKEVSEDSGIKAQDKLTEAINRRPTVDDLQPFPWEKGQV